VLAAEIFKLLTDSGDPAAALFTLCALIMNVVLAISKMIKCEKIQVELVTSCI